MKKINPLAVVLVALAAFAGAFLLVGANEESQYHGPAFSTFNTNNDGTALLFDIVKATGHPVTKSYREISRGTSVLNVQVIIMPDESVIDFDGIARWVKEGGYLIYGGRPFDSGVRKAFELNLPAYGIYEYGFGRVYFIDPDSLLNERLMSNSAGAKAMLGVIDQWSFGEIVFNEYYHGFQQTSNMWNDMPLHLKFMIIHVVIAILLFVLYKGKRLGDPVPLYEEIERSENEYLLALSNLYRNSNSPDFPVRAFYGGFISRCAEFFRLPRNYTEENIESIWSDAGLKNLDLLLSVKNTVEETSNKKIKFNKKAVRPIIRDIEKLISSIK